MLDTQVGLLVCQKSRRSPGVWAGAEQPRESRN